MGFTYGLTPLIGALFTQKRFDTIGAMIRTGVWLNIAFTLLVTAVMTLVWLNPRPHGPARGTSAADTSVLSDSTGRSAPYIVIQCVRPMALRHQPYASADVDCLGRKML